MMLQKSENRFNLIIVLLSYFFALVLALLPFGHTYFSLLKPDFFVLIIAAVSLSFPNQISFACLLVVGILYDGLMLNPVIGQTALALLICAMICLRFQKKRQFFSSWQEALFVGLLSLQSSLISALFSVALTGELNLFLLMGPVLSNVIIWALVNPVLSR